MKNLIVITGLVAALAAGSSIAQAKPDHPGGHGHGKAGERGAHGKSKRCAKVQKVGFVVKGTYVSGDENSVTLLVTKANRHALRSGLVTVGEAYTATPTKPGAIRYVNRTGPSDAQSTDRVRVQGKVTRLKRECSAEGFTPTASVRKVKVVGPDPTEAEAPETESGS